MFKSSAFDRLLEKATSKLLLDPDWESNLQICDVIRQGDIQPSYAIQGIRKKIENENPHVALFALQVLESAVKNCGSLVHNEISTRDFMEFLRDQARTRQDPVKAKILELVQVWSHAFRNESQYKVVIETFNILKAEGASFPTLKESDAMFLSEKAPEWRDGETCHRCRVQFGTFQRKHHCRACGQVFCQKCSSKNSIIPKYGIEKEVRVCDGCHDSINKPTEKKSEDELPAEYLASSLSKQSQAPPTRSEQELREEEELQLALALSESEAEAAKSKQRGGRFTSYGGSTNTSSSAVNDSANSLYSQPSKVVSAAPTVIDTSDMDPELALYLNRNYWQQKSIEMKGGVGQGGGAQPSAPVGVMESKNNSTNYKESSEYSNGDVSNVNNSESDVSREQFLNALHSSVEIFVNRMKSNSQRGRSIANDSSVQTLFMTLNAMHPQLISYIQEQEERRAHYESLQDKLTQLKDARDALDVLREEHMEKKRREQEELERQRQVLMMQKLELLRQKKQEYLEYQRQLALQRMQDQEMEMRRRLEQQKQDQHMRAMQYTHPHSGYPSHQAQLQTYPPQSMPNADGSPHHQMHPGSYGYGVTSYGMSLPSGMPGQIPGPAPGQMPGQLPGQAPGQMPSQASGQLPGQMGGGGQPIYSQSGEYAGQGYQPQMSGYPPNMPPQSMAQMSYGGPSHPQMQQQMYANGSGSAQGMEGPYNMQGMSNALPQQMPGGVEYMPPHSMQGQGQGQYMSEQPMQQHQPGPHESALINFD